jgi:Ca2+-binding EF-hand superfamily protein
MGAELIQINGFARTHKIKKQIIAFIARRVPESKIGNLKQIFMDCDKDKNGFLDENEMQTCLK